MAYQKLQSGVALSVIPSDHINIPNPSGLLDRNSGAITGAAVGSRNLEGSGSSTFTDGSLKIGDIVYHEGAGGTPRQALRIIAIVDATNLTVDNGNGAAPTNSTSADFRIYKDRREACVLYVGGTGNLSVRMAGGNNRDSDVLFNAVAVGYHPIQVCQVRVTGTTATDIVALW